MLCECGCGQVTKVARQTDTRAGHIGGQHQRFIVGHNHRNKVRVSGYRTVYRPDHPRASASGDVYQHFLVAEAALGHALPLGAAIHHVNEIKQDNRNTNLVICQDHAYHKLLHYRARIVRAGGDPDTQKICSFCRLVLPLSVFYRMAHVQSGKQNGCRDCMAAARRRRNGRAA